MTEQADNVQQVFDLMPTHFLPEQARYLEAVIQMDLSGDDGGRWYLTVKDQDLTVSPGTHGSPDMTMTMAAGDWLDIANSNANAIALFIQGKINIQGDMQLAMKMQTMFKYSNG